MSDYQKAKEKALELLDLYNIKEPIVPVFDIAKTEGLKIVGFENSDKLRDFSGFFNSKEKTIYINIADSPNRQIFTVAHELGHYKLQHDLKGLEILPRYVNPIAKDPNEQEANFFAANLLVPENMLRKMMKKYKLNSFDTDLLAKLFGVSKEVMVYRVKDLEL